ncbi:hypothetical protein F2Q68_00039621 [Brassica cretica]|uniref:Uncharacterized protein n=1 Tax=Brassica cretica TaxID=69181 RepID=A0A8S9MHD8_BRACR|nr:hypothetical protein F2Q68_00039621 [Brassica cretica]
MLASRRSMLVSTLFPQILFRMNSVSATVMFDTATVSINTLISALAKAFSLSLSSGSHNQVVPPESNEQQRLLRISLRICGTLTLVKGCRHLLQHTLQNFPYDIVVPRFLRCY